MLIEVILCYYSPCPQFHYSIKRKKSYGYIEYNSDDTFLNSIRYLPNAYPLSLKNISKYISVNRVKQMTSMMVRR